MGAGGCPHSSQPIGRQRRTKTRHFMASFYSYPHLYDQRQGSGRPPNEYRGIGNSRLRRRMPPPEKCTGLCLAQLHDTDWCVTPGKCVRVRVETNHRERLNRQLEALPTSSPLFQSLSLQGKPDVEQHPSSGRADATRLRALSITASRTTIAMNNVRCEVAGVVFIFITRSRYPSKRGIAGP